jgi:hypothetical protein
MNRSWIYDPAPPSGSKRGGLANAEVFEGTLDSFTREVLQNAKDQTLNGNPVVVRFTLSEISGSHLADFLQAIDWPVLREHIVDSAESGGVTIGPRLREGLDEIEENGVLRIMSIEDTGTRGLTGDEDEEDSNFNALCRHELVTSRARRASGGSFGLGKSVLWRFSLLSTVLFSSVIEGTERLRFFGRALLPGHEAGGKAWEGSGWFGAPDPDPGRPRAVSLFDDEAREAATACLLTRPSETGTSILILGFDEPQYEVERDINLICSDIVDASVRWFWPALLNEDLRVFVEGYEDDEQVFAKQAQPVTPEVVPFALALQQAPEVSDVIESPGEVAERELTVDIPGQRERFEHPRGPVEAKATLRIRLAESGEDQLPNTVALQRGTGMVVRYQEIRRRSGSDSPFHAVLLAGSAHGDTEADEALEEFLRAAEPPAHAEWTPATERIKAEYKQGGKKTLDALFAGIEVALNELTREEVEESDDGPDQLKRLFPLPGTGTALREPTYRLSDAGAYLDGLSWTFSGRFGRKSEDKDGAWRFRVAMFLDQEGSGAGSARGMRVPIATFGADDGTVIGPASDGTFEVGVPAGVESVRFHGTTGEIGELPPGGQRRVRLRMDLRGARAGQGAKA